MKICATTLGETAGDLLSMTLNVGYAVSSLILISAFLVTLASQLLREAFHPFLYWTVILTTSTAGTTMSDYMDRTLGPRLREGRRILLVASCSSCFAFWRLTAARSRSTTSRAQGRELFYWTAILFSNTLGTALGDFLADDSGLGLRRRRSADRRLARARRWSRTSTRSLEGAPVLGRVRADPPVRRDLRRRAHQAGRARRPRIRHGSARRSCCWRS